ncbi:MAG TPA: MFS transporter [Gaiellaceae bacterium]|nr:MFS transporter [Gaiellaceae bacterium]
MSGYLRSLNPRLPRSVQILQLGGLLNGIGNGLVLPFTFIYLHNERGFSLGLAGLILGVNGAVSLLVGPLSGTLVDRLGGKRVLGLALFFLMLGYGGYALVERPWHAFLASALTGIGNGLFWAAQSTLIAGLTPAERRPAAFAMQRVVMNLGIGIGGLLGGFLAAASFRLLFVGDALTFVLYAAVLVAFVPQPERVHRREGERAGTYRDVFRYRVFVALLVVNSVYVFAGYAMLELIAPYAKNEASVGEQWIGPIFAINTLVIVLAQLPIARLAEGRRRMPIFASIGVVWAASWLLVPVAGLWFAGVAAAMMISLAAAVFAIGECLHGAVQAPLVADLADPRLLGRYMAMSAFSWQVGFTIGPPIGGVLLSASPTGLWIFAASVCLAAAVGALALERALPEGVRRSPVSDRRDPDEAEMVSGTRVESPA